MKNNTFINGRMALACILFSLILFSCKYKDGPAISFRSADSRIIGNYEADAFTVDGQDALQLWKDSISDIIFSLYHEVEPTDNYWISTRVKSEFLSGNYKLVADDTQLLIYSLEETAAFPGAGPFRENKESTWDIYKLSKKRIWMQTEFEGHIYYVELKQIE